MSGAGTASNPGSGAGADSAGVCVRTPSGSYEIVVGHGLLDDPATFFPIAARAAALVVSNSVVAPLLAERVVASLRASFAAVDLVVLDDGESHKTWAAVERIFDALLAMGADRESQLFALGGGVVGDLTGFASATYMRGVGYVQLPTTLLAQVDSSVGGKTGINLASGKNLVGAFHQPRRVVADLDTLATLPQRELVAGIAEVIKYGAVADPMFFDWIESHLDAMLGRDPAALRHVVVRSCELKATIVGLDEKEAGVRAVLNFGHTFGHAIEAVLGFGTWLHGEAVGCGMVLAADLSRRLGLTDVASVKRLASLVERAGLPVRLPAVAADALLGSMQHDKKSTGGAPRFVLLDSIGRARLLPVDTAVVREVLIAHGALPEAA